jgi:hypothetical protein
LTAKEPHLLKFKLTHYRTFNQSSTGQWMAFGLAIFFGIVAWDLARNGHEAIAGIIAGIDLTGLVAVFITGRILKK